MKALFAAARSCGIKVEYTKLPENSSLSIEYNGQQYIAMDYSLLFKTSEERVHLAHELGHCITGSFYNFYSCFDIRAKQEYRADVWAAEQLIPVQELLMAFERGYSELWQLSDYFQVTESFIVTVIDIYKRKGILPQT